MPAFSQGLEKALHHGCQGRRALDTDDLALEQRLELVGSFDGNAPFPVVPAAPQADYSRHNIFRQFHFPWSQTQVDRVQWKIFH